MEETTEDNGDIWKLSPAQLLGYLHKRTSDHWSVTSTQVPLKRALSAVLLRRNGVASIFLVIVQSWGEYEVWWKPIPGLFPVSFATTLCEASGYDGTHCSVLRDAALHEVLSMTQAIDRHVDEHTDGPSAGRDATSKMSEDQLHDYLNMHLPRFWEADITRGVITIELDNDEVLCITPSESAWTVKVADDDAENLHVFEAVCGQPEPRTFEHAGGVLECVLEVVRRLDAKEYLSAKALVMDAKAREEEAAKREMAAMHREAAAARREAAAKAREEEAAAMMRMITPENVALVRSFDRMVRAMRAGTTVGAAEGTVESTGRANGLVMKTCVELSYVHEPTDDTH